MNTSTKSTLKMVCDAHEISRNKPSRLKYIMAFLLSGILTNAHSTVATMMLIGLIGHRISDPNLLFTTLVFILACVRVGTIILVYEAFSSLNMKKVMIYIYALWASGIALDILQYREDGIGIMLSPSIFYLVTLIFGITPMCILRWYFANKSERWRSTRDRIR